MAGGVVPLDVYVSRLEQTGLDVKNKLAVATDIRDSLDKFIVPQEYPNFLAKLLPVFKKILQDDPVFDVTHNEHKLRNCILDIIHRLPFQPPDLLEKHATELMVMLMALVRVENEENAVLCMKTIGNFYRNCGKALAEQAEPTLELIRDMFQRMPAAVKEAFDTKSGANGQPSTPGNANLQSPKPMSPMVVGQDPSESGSRSLVKGMQSFKVLAECPIIVVSIFTHHRPTSKDIKAFTPHITTMLLEEAAPQAEAHRLAKENGDGPFTGVSAGIKNRVAFGDFITAQVKTMSFLAYILRQFSNELKDFLASLPSIVVRLLKDCPRERSGARKELLVATRHIINFSFRKMFVDSLDELLDERVLIGDGLTVYETMRPLAYSTLADLIHHVRPRLNRDHIAKTVEVYTKNLHDDFPGTSFQTMSAKLLLNLAEVIPNLPDKKEARHFLMMILDAIAEKFAAMNRQYENVKEQALASQADSEDSLLIPLGNDTPPPPQHEYDEIDIFNAYPIKTTNPRDRGAGPVLDNKFLLKTLVNGLKDMLPRLNRCNPSQPGGETNPYPWPPPWKIKEMSFGFSAEDVNIMIKLFREGAPAFRYYTLDPQTKPTPTGDPASDQLEMPGKEERDLLEVFATVFHFIDPATFHEVFDAEMPHLYEIVFEHTALLHIPQFFLASEGTSPSFCGMLLQFLMDHIHEVGSADRKRAQILLRLFKLSFMAVPLFPLHNEAVLLPHVSKIVTESIRLSTTAEEPMNYFHLLRNLFRSIGGGRFEQLYKELLPLLEVLLEVLNTLLLSAKRPQEKDLYVELCLTVPARLSNLLPHLSFLMKPLVAALRGGPELVTLGLRTLELCVENLLADYLDPIMAPVINDLMEALWQQLKPLPHSHIHSHTTMRILGKLGGRNRRFLTHPPSLRYKGYSDDECSVQVKLHGTPGNRAFPLFAVSELAVDKLIRLQTAKNPLGQKADEFYKREALQLVINNIKLLIGYNPLPDNFIETVKGLASDICADNLTLSSMSTEPEPSDRTKPMAKRHAQEATLRKLLATCLFAASIPELKAEASAFILDVCRHVTILEIGKAVQENKKSKQSFHVESGEGAVHLDTRVLADAISDSLSSNDSNIRGAGIEAIKVIYEAASILFGSAELASKLPFFSTILKCFCHNCYEEDWYPKFGGCTGIRTLFEDLVFDETWMVEKQQEVVRALLYVIKDMPLDLPASTREIAQSTLEVVLRKCNKKTDTPIEKVIEYHSKTWGICAVMIPEISNSNKYVRETARKSFGTLAEIYETDLNTLMAPVKDRLLKLIFNKPLRALPFATQIGYIDAITFCLELPQNLVEFNEEFVRLLLEALALADADDEQLHSNKNTPEYRTTESVLNLRVVCIKLLSKAISYQELSMPQHHATRGRIISVFFKSLYSRSPEVIEAANQGLKGVLSQTSKLPKELLQNGLRPILMNLSDPKRLNVAGLEGLARLLQLLTNYFKVEIGTRLLDHLKNLAEPSAMHSTSFRFLEQHQGIRVMKAILNIFHLLPPAAVQFMADIFAIVLDLEEKLRRTRNSPFRKPLLQFVARFSGESWQFLGPRMKDLKYGRLLAQIAGDPYSSTLRTAITSDLAVLKKYTVEIENPKEKAVAMVNLVHLIHTMAQFTTTRDWLQQNRDFMLLLLDVGIKLRERLRKGDLEVDHRLPVEEASTLLIEIFTIYFAHSGDDMELLFKVIDATATGNLKRTHALTHYIYKYIICSKSVEYWRKVVYGCLEVYSQKSSSQQTKSYIFHYLVNPILAMDAYRKSPTVDGHKLIDKSMIDEIHAKVWRPNLGDLGDDSSPGLDHARMELLQMSALLIQEHWKELESPRKDVIKFGWNYLKLEDIVNKQAAYVLVAYFIAHFETPSKIVMQVYVALLKAHQNEARALVTQALKLIAPVLPKRLPGDPKYPIWARWPRRILAEDGHNPQQMTNIFQFLVRHGNLFYESREHFVNWIVSSLPKLTVTTSSTPSTENKKLSVALINLLWTWEQERVSRLKASPENSPKKRKLAVYQGDTRSPSSGPTGAQQQQSTEKEYLMSPQLRAAVIKQLIKFICGATEKITHVEMLKQSLKLFTNLLGPDYWNDAEIDLNPFVAPLGPVEINEQPTKAINCLQILQVIVKLKQDEWISERVPDLQRLLDSAMRSKVPEIHQNLEPILQRMLETVPEEVEEEEEESMESKTPSAQFIVNLNKIISDNLSTNPVSSISLLWVLSKVRPPAIDEHLTPLMKAFPKLAKDHLSVVPQPASVLANPAAPPQPSEIETTIKLLVKMIDIAASRVSSLQDQRRAFLSVLAQLVEKSTSSELCLKILAVARSWVFGYNEPFPTLKEKAAVITKMLVFERRADKELCGEFLKLVIDIYENDQITKTDLTVRLEPAFLVGTRAQDVEMRNRFLRIFDRSLSATTSTRVQFILANQNWEILGDSYWLHQAVHLIIGSIEKDFPLQLHDEDMRLLPISAAFKGLSKPRPDSNVMVDDKLEDLMIQHRKFILSLNDVKASQVFAPLAQLQHLDAEIGHQIWISLFPLMWSSLGVEDRRELSKGLVTLMAKDYHHRQIDARPNVIQSILEGVDRAKPTLNLPHHMIKFLARTYDAWYTSIHILEKAAVDPPLDSENVRDSNLDALVEMYAGLGEDDMFYGLWRRRSQFLETNAALSYEQNGIWQKAQNLYESAQVRARSGNLPFSSSEYMLWEDHWILCAQKLQQWDILSEFAKLESYNDLLLECAWRLIENWNGPDGERIDQTVKSLMDTPTPRRMFFSAFLALQKIHAKSEAPNEFSKICDEAIQLSLRKWHSLPKRITNAHIPLLQNFQQLVELHDAHVIYNSLNQTTQQNLDTKSQELKLLLTVWRDRLPNTWDEINSWNDLVTWRQHIFHSINNTYLPLLPPQSATGNNNNNSYAYRGYHETAWIINRFAHVARKHQLYDVCTVQLSKIYMLPNIEIQEAFLKLREQATCCYYSNQLNSGLEVINNTNLGYFGNPQKAEFYTLKGMFLSKLNQREEANESFSLALYHDLKLAKAWAEWGRYNDQLFKEQPGDYQFAMNAVSCYQEAAGLYKNEKSRKLLSRVLWLLSLDDPKGQLVTTFETYKGEIPVWHWISYIPQLLLSLAHKEHKVARILLINIAKNYPQALYFLLRTSKEEYLALKKQAAARSANQGGKAGSPTMPSAGAPNGAANGEGQGSPNQNQAQIKKTPADVTEEIMAILKTAFPLLALSMETMGDQISKFFKCPPDEDAYRLIVALLNDGLQHIGRQNPKLENTKLPPATEANITRFAETILPGHIRVAFEADFVAKKPDLFTYINKLRTWRDRFEEKLDHRTPVMHLESISPHLSEFRFQKFDDVEVPGQYLLHRDDNKGFIKIDRFLPNVDLVRGYGVCHRRLRMRGHDGSVHTFAVQHPAPRPCRREERIVQLFRIFNRILSKKKESRRRNLAFHLPIMVPLAPHIRLVEDDASAISLQAIYEDHCRKVGMSKDEPIIYSMRKVISTLEATNKAPLDPTIKMEIFNAIQKEKVPNDIALDFLQKTFPSFTEFYLFRRQFSYQFAALTFMTYIMSMNLRFPHKIFVARDTGTVWGTELIPALAQNQPAFHNNEPVPFRFTPNLQMIMGPLATEGIYSCAMLVLSRCLTEPEFDLEAQLSIFVRDEMLWWFSQQRRVSADPQLLERVNANAGIIVRKAASLAAATTQAHQNLPANQPVIDLISKSVNPMNLAMSDYLWMPYL